MDFLCCKSKASGLFFKAAVFALAFLTILIFDIQLKRLSIEENRAIGKAMPSNGIKKPVEQSKKIYYRDAFAIITYHHIDSSESTYYTISPNRFSEQITTLKKLGYNFVSLDDATQFMEGKKEIPINAIVVTFDDGWDSFYRIAYPILKRNKVPASMFVIAGTVNRGEGDWQRLTWSQMKTMQKDGYTFYSHTYDSHRYVTVDDSGTVLPALTGYIRKLGLLETETASEFDARVRADLSKSRIILHNGLGRPANYLALPFGSINEQATKIALEVGFKYILTMRSWLNTRYTQPTSLLRFDAGNPGKDGASIHRDITKAAAVQFARRPQKPAKKAAGLISLPSSVER